MILVILLAVLAVWAIASTVVELRRDGYRRVPTDWDRVPVRDALDRAEAGHTYR